MNKIYQVWIEDNEGIETVIFEGTKTMAYKYYNSHKHVDNLHIGYLLSVELLNK